MHYIIHLSLFMLCTATNITTTMQSEKNLGVPVYLKNLSMGLMNNTYDVYIQVVSFLNVSKSTINRERFIPYDDVEMVGYLAKIKDIKIRGNSIISGWTCNKEILDQAKQDALNGKDTSDGNLLFIVSAGMTGFYLSYYNWRPSNLHPLGLKRNNDSGEYIFNASQIDESYQSDEPHPSDDFKLIR